MRLHHPLQTPIHRRFRLRVRKRVRGAQCADRVGQRDPISDFPSQPLLRCRAIPVTPLAAAAITGRAAAIPSTIIRLNCSDTAAHARVGAVALEIGEGKAALDQSAPAEPSATSGMQVRKRLSAGLHYSRAVVR
jgi:hypothetical protein